MYPARESAGGVVVRPDGKIAIVCQGGTSWSLPKGGVEEGETLEQAARREIWEEAGIKNIEMAQNLGSFFRRSMTPDGKGERMEWPETKRSYFLFKTSMEEPFGSNGSETTDARFVSVDEAIEMLTHQKDKEFLRSVRDKIVYA